MDFDQYVRTVASSIRDSLAGLGMTVQIGKELRKFLLLVYVLAFSVHHDYHTPTSNCF